MAAEETEMIRTETKKRGRPTIGLVSDHIKQPKVDTFIIKKFPRFILNKTAKTMLKDKKDGEKNRKFFKEKFGFNDEDI